MFKVSAGDASLPTHWFECHVESSQYNAFFTEWFFFIYLKMFLQHFLNILTKFFQFQILWTIPDWSKQITSNILQVLQNYLIRKHLFIHQLQILIVSQAWPFDKKKNILLTLYVKLAKHASLCHQLMWW